MSYRHMVYPLAGVQSFYTIFERIRGVRRGSLARDYKAYTEAAEDRAWVVDLGKA